MTSLTRKTISAAKWYSVLSFTQQLIQFGVTITLARILSPNEFGLMAIVTTFIGIVRMFQDIGLGPAIVQKKVLTGEFLDSVYWFSQGFGFLIFCFFSAIAFIIADFYQNEILLPLTIISSLGFIITPYFMIQSRLLERELDLKKLSLVSITVIPISGAITILLALNDWGVWSLVIGGLVGQILHPIITLRFIKWQPHFCFRWEFLKGSLGFGLNLSASKMVGHLSQNAVFLIIGKIIGINPLGIFKVGNRMVLQPLLLISSYLSKPLLASYSRVQDDSIRLKRAYLMTMNYLATIILPSAAGIAVIAPEFVLSLLGQKWADTIPIMQLLSIVGVLTIAINTGTSVFYAKGETIIPLKWNIISACINIPAIIIAAQYGISTVVLTMTIISLPMFLLMQTWINNLLDLSWFDFLKNIFIPIVLSIVMAILTYLVRLFLLEISLNIPIKLIIEIFSGILFYTFLNFMFNKEAIITAWNMVFVKP